MVSGEFDRQYSVRVCPPLLWVTPKLERAHFRCSHSLQEGHTAVVIASDVLMVVPEVVSSRYGGGVLRNTIFVLLLWFLLLRS